MGFPVQILTFTTLYPSASQPQHGIFVETRLRKLVESGAVGARVVAPCPWFPIGSAWFGRYAVFARIPGAETRHELRVDHPRYPLLPKIGMSVAPLALATAVLPSLRRQIRDGRDFDLIDAHYFYPDGVAAVLLGRALGRPVVVTARGSDLNNAARHALGVTRPSLLAVGNLVALKRHHLMIEALTQLPGVELVIVGEGPERGAIERLAHQRRVADRVRLLGYVAQDRLSEIYGAADLLLLVSSHEGWPNVLLESMACGTPVVVSDIGGIADIVAAPEAGRILADVAPSRLAATVRELLAAPPPRGATRIYAEQFDWQSTTEGQIALFHQISERRLKEEAVVHAA